MHVVSWSHIAKITNLKERKKRNRKNILLGSLY